LAQLEAVMAFWLVGLAVLAFSAGVYVLAKMGRIDGDPYDGEDWS
jgi:uncharacterized membrane protein YczE